MSPPAGEVWLADLGLTAKTRPVVILSREDANAPRDLAIYVPLTTQYRGSRYEVAPAKAEFSARRKYGECARHRLDPGPSVAVQNRKCFSGCFGSNSRSASVCT